MHFISFILVSFLFAENLGPKTGDPWTEFQKAYKSGKKSKLSGNVLSYDEEGKDSEGGIKINLGVGNKVVEVQMGPQWFILQQDLNLTRGQPMVVEGIRIRLGSAPARIIAERATQQGKEVVFREASGEPKWKKVERQPPQTDPDTTRPLVILTKNCAPCHQKANHPGAKFLQQRDLSEVATMKLVLKMVETGDMPKQHREFRNSPDGKELIAWLRNEIKVRD